MKNEKLKILSHRLSVVASMVPEHVPVADIGCDHAYVSIYMAEHSPDRKVYALDVRRGPLETAAANIKESGCESRIIIRQSDGFDALKKGETKAAVLSGMGGKLIVKLLTNGIEKMEPLYELVLSPQSEPELVRRFLRKNGFIIHTEEMLEEEGKFYVVLGARLVRGIVNDTNSVNCFENSDVVNNQNIDREDSELQNIYDLFGKNLLEKRNVVLFKYLKEEEHKQRKVLDMLKLIDTENASVRADEINKNLEIIYRAIGFYDMKST